MQLVGGSFRFGTRKKEEGFASGGGRVGLELNYKENTEMWSRLDEVIGFLWFANPSKTDVGKGVKERCQFYLL